MNGLLYIYFAIGAVMALIGVLKGQRMSAGVTMVTITAFILFWPLCIVVYGLFGRQHGH